MSTESFHQSLRRLAAKTIYETQEATLATFNDSFICIEPIEEFPGVEMIQAVYVAEKQRGKGIVSLGAQTVQSIGASNGTS